MDGIKIGIAGCGWISRHAHINAMSNIYQSEKVAIFDKDKKSLKEMGDTWGIQKRYQNFNEFLDSGIRGIVIATPNYTHKDFAIQALRSRKWVLCEKPIVIDEKEMQEVVKNTGENIKFLIPAFVNRFRFDIEEFLRAIKSIGCIKKIEAKWNRKNGIPRPGSWFTNKSMAGGGVLMDLGPHVIDICFYILNSFHLLKENSIKIKSSEPTWLTEKEICESGAGWFQGRGNGTFQINVESKMKSTFMVGDVLIDLDLKWTDESKDYTQFIVTGTEGSACLNTLFGFSDCRKWDHAEIILCKNGDSISKKYVNDVCMQTAAFQEMHKYFLECVTKNTARNLDIEDAIKTTIVIDAIYKKAGIKR